MQEKPFKIKYCSKIYEHAVIEDMTEMIDKLMPIIGSDVLVLYSLIKYQQMQREDDIFYISKNYIIENVGCFQKTVMNVYERLQELKLIEYSDKEQRQQTRSTYVCINYDEIYKYMQIDYKEKERIKKTIKVNNKKFNIHNFLQAYLRRNEDDEESDKLEFKDYMTAFNLNIEIEKDKLFSDILSDCITSTPKNERQEQFDITIEDLEERIYNDLLAWTYQLKNKTADTTKIRYDLDNNNFYIYVDYSRYKTKNIEKALTNLIQKGKLLFSNNKYCVKELIENKNKTNTKPQKMKSNRVEECLNTFIETKTGVEIPENLYNSMKQFCEYLNEKGSCNKYTVQRNFTNLMNSNVSDDEKIKIINESIAKNYNSLVYVMEQHHLNFVNYDKEVSKISDNKKVEKKKKTAEELLTDDEFLRLWDTNDFEIIEKKKKELAQEGKSIEQYIQEKLGINIKTRS